MAGDPEMKVTRILLGPGSGVPMLTDAFDVSIGGETAESGGNAGYVADAAALGQPKGVILLGHMLSEDQGMREVGDWLKTFITDVPHLGISGCSARNSAVTLFAASPMI